MEVFFRPLGSSVAISLAENVFLSTISGPLKKIVPQKRSTSILETGIRAFVDLSKNFPLAEQQEAEIVLGYGVSKAFIIPLVATSSAAAVSWGI
jgi:hypothetical protein